MREHSCRQHFTRQPSSLSREAGLALREKQDQQQLKTFTRWWNSWLKENLAEGWSGITVTDLCKEIKPGVISMHLIELLSGTHSIEEKETPSTVFP